jgi:hypothetical protein
MTVLTPNQPVTVMGPLLSVEAAPPAAPLPPGTHQVQLVVVDDQGNRSAPAAVTVTVLPAPVPQPPPAPGPTPPPPLMPAAVSRSQRGPGRRTAKPKAPKS